MSFQIERIPQVELMTVRESGGRRYYTLPSGVSYPSVTTVIGNYLPKIQIDAWKRRIGEEEAHKVLVQAVRRGSAVHLLCEKYLEGTLTMKDRMQAMPTNLESFSNIKTHLDSNVDVVYGIEYAVYSHILRTAGRVDLIARWAGVNSIIDFKTSRRVKDESFILGYLIQASTYAKMIEEHINIKIPQIVIVIAVDHEPVQVFVKMRNDYEEYITEAFITKRAEWDIT